MKKSSFILLGAVALTLVSCESKAGTGALVGGGLGVGTGALIGGPQGAVIGGAVGAIGGAAVGAAMDSSDRQSLEQKSPDTMNRIDNNQRLSLNDIKSMSEAGIKDDVIISMIQKTNSRYNLTSAQVIDLKNAGVSQKVIDYMINNT